MQSFFARTKKKGVMKMKKIIVAGAGHGGIAAAALLAKQGYDVTVLEMKKRADMGHDWHDVMAKSSLTDVGFTMPADGTFTPKRKATPAFSASPIRCFSSSLRSM